MQVLNKHFKQHLTLISVGLLLSSNLAIAATDLTAQENYLKARVKSLEQNSNHENHIVALSKIQIMKTI